MRDVDELILNRKASAVAVQKLRKMQKLFQQIAEKGGYVLIENRERK